MDWLVPLLASVTLLLAIRPLWQGLASAGALFMQNLHHSAHKDWAGLFLFPDVRTLLYLYSILLIVAVLTAWCLDLNLLPSAMLAGLACSLPRLLISRLRTRRQQDLLRQLPEAMQGLASSMRAGASFQSALENIVREGQAPVAQELALVLKELRMGSPMTEAFENLSQRYPDEDIRLLVASIALNREVGGNFAQLLDRLAGTMRLKFEMRGKIDALTSQGRMQGWVMTALPVFIGGMIGLLEPAAMQMLFTTSWGWLVLVLAVLMLGTGAFFIRKVVAIDV